MMTEHGLPRSSRLTCSEAFARVKAEGARARSGPLLMSVATGDGRRIGVVVSRRVGKAVHRNRIRRVVKERFRTGRDRMPKGDCVVVAHGGAAELSNNDLAAHLDRAALKLISRTA